jgi:hypothetical protein
MIRAVVAGIPYELVARQLGHADVQMVATRYGRHAPAQRRARPVGEDRGAIRRTGDDRAPRANQTIWRKWVQFWVQFLETTRANHSEVIGSSIAGVGLAPTTPAF